MITLDRYGLSLTLFAAVGAALLLTGCEEALTDSTDEGLPNIDGTGEPWVEITGADTTTALEERGTQVEFTVAPGYTTPGSLEVFFSVPGNGTAQQGRDYVVQTSSPVTIPIDPDASQLEDEDIVVGFPESDQVNEVTNMTLQLDSARTLSGESVPVGRGGTDDNDAKFVSIDWSKASIFFQNSAGYRFDDTETGTSSSSGFDLLIANTDAFRSTDVSNFAIEGENAGAFQVAGFFELLPPDFATPAPATTPFTVEPAQGNLLVVVVQFAPESEGEKSATLTYEATNVAEPSKSVPLLGTGTAP